MKCVGEYRTTWLSRERVKGSQKFELFGNPGPRTQQQVLYPVKGSIFASSHLEPCRPVARTPQGVRATEHVPQSDLGANGLRSKASRAAGDTLSPVKALLTRQRRALVGAPLCCA